jgi:hypothetical protein
MAEEKQRKTSKINTWKPKKNQVFVEPDGKLFVCHFDKIFGYSNLRVYNKFIINKGSYENQLGIITKYTNFFMNLYDTDNELATAYLKLKFSLDKEKRFTEENMNAFIDFIYEVIFTPTMVDKIVRMVEDNYLDDIEGDSEEKKKYMKNEKKHLESLEFTNQHIKILLRISFGMKIMSPVLFHYLALNVIKAGKDTDIIFRFYQDLFKIFGYGTTYELKDENGNILDNNVPQSFIDEGVKNKELTPVKSSDRRLTYYYTESGTYYALQEINMYNKLYCYVN